MDNKTYETLFDRTLADVFFPDHVSPMFVASVLAQRKETAELIDGVKRALFYNKPDRLGVYAGQALNLLGLSYPTDPEILHATLGLEGEVGEITEAALDESLTFEERRSRVLDEGGDLLWYLALMFKKHDITFDEAFAKNIDKLSARYPDKFTTQAAVERDLNREAAVFTGAPA